MTSTSTFDLHAAESAAQAAATWLILEALSRAYLKNGAERVEFLDRLLEAAESITLPAGEDPKQIAAAEWIANRYWALIEGFTARLRA